MFGDDWKTELFGVDVFSTHQIVIITCNFTLAYAPISKTAPQPCDTKEGRPRKCAKIEKIMTKENGYH
jgi:hypothetical protein